MRNNCSNNGQGKSSQVDDSTWESNEKEWNGEEDVENWSDFLVLDESQEQVEQEICLQELYQVNDWDSQVIKWDSNHFMIKLFDLDEPNKAHKLNHGRDGQWNEVTGMVDHTPQPQFLHLSIQPFLILTGLGVQEFLDDDQLRDQDSHVESLVMVKSIVDI